MFNTLRAVLACVLLLCTAPAPAETLYNQGVEAWRIKDYAQARKHWEQSLVEGGPDEALNNLAYLYYYGLGGESRPGKAVELWRKGAVLAVSEAQWHLGQAYIDGLAVEANLPKAYAWFQCAIATATKRLAEDHVEQEIAESAKTSLAKLEPHLTSSELAEGQRLAEQFTAKYSQRLSASD